MVVGKNIHIFQIVVAVFRCCCNENTNDDIFLIISIKVILRINIGIPMTSTYIVIENLPCGTSIYGIDYSKGGRTARAITYRKVELCILKADSRETYFKILIMFRSVTIIRLRCKLIDRRRIEAQQVTVLTLLHLPFSITGLQRKLVIIQNSITSIWQKHWLLSFPSCIRKCRPPTSIRGISYHTPLTRGFPPL